MLKRSSWYQITHWSRWTWISLKRKKNQTSDPAILASWICQRKGKILQGHYCFHLWTGLSLNLNSYACMSSVSTITFMISLFTLSATKAIRPTIRPFGLILKPRRGRLWCPNKQTIKSIINLEMFPIELIAHYTVILFHIYQDQSLTIQTTNHQWS